MDFIENIDSYNYIIEPSAGSGNFLKFLPNDTFAFDIEPEGENIVKQDFLELKLNLSGNVLFVGNPPFGKRSILAKSFIKKSIALNATTIAFILPDTFKKYTNQSVFPKEWKLLKVLDLPKNSFIVNGNDYHVPCSFFVWSIYGSVNLRDRKMCSNEDFCFLKRGSLEADFCINGNTGAVKKINNVKNQKAEHYIKHKKKSVEYLMDVFLNIQYNKLSSVNGGNYWINQSDILKAYYEFERNKLDV